MIVHVPQIPHTTPSRRFSHCAFTQKARLLPGMLKSQGFDVVAYGVGDGAEVDATEWVSLMSEDEHLALLGLASYDDEPIARQVGDRAMYDTPAYRQFNAQLRAELHERLFPGDAIALPFGLAHEGAYRSHPLVDDDRVVVVETGVGYPDPATFVRVYESEAWRHWTLGSETRHGMDWRTRRLEWVVPNYYDPEDWPFDDLREPPMAARLDGDAARTVVYLGRLDTIKGLDLVPQLARARPDLLFKLCGQGDPAPFLTEPNIVYVPPIYGRARVDYLRNARCGLYPSRFVEPFCGAAVETMLCGTPVVTSDFGAFTETVVPYVSGFRCRTVDKWLRALDDVAWIGRVGVRSHASQYLTPRVAARYRVVFDELADRLRSGA